MKSPFPSGEGSALRSIRPPGNALSCRDGGDASVWSAPFPAQALRSSEGRIFRPTVSSRAKQILSSGNPLSHRGKVPHCGAFVHPETPFSARMEGTPLSGAPRFRLKRSDHRKAGSSGPRSAAARNKSSPVEIPFPIGGRFRIAGRSSTRKRPFLPGWRGRPCLERPVSGSSAQIIGRLDLPAHGQQQREAKPLQ